MPNAPSYLGIDLALTGTQILPKSTGNRPIETPPISSYYFVPTLKLPEQTTLPPHVDADEVDRKPMRRTSTSTPRQPSTSRLAVTPVAKTPKPMKNGHVSRFRTLKHSVVAVSGSKMARDRSRPNAVARSKLERPTSDADSVTNVKPTVTFDRHAFSSSMPLLPLDDGGQRRIQGQPESHPGMNCVGTSCRKTLPTIASLFRPASMSSNGMSAIESFPKRTAHQLLYRTYRTAQHPSELLKNQPMDVNVGVAIPPFRSLSMGSNEAVLEYKSGAVSSVRRRKIKC